MASLSKNLEQVLEQVYRGFAHYPRPNLATLSLFDFGPTEKELKEVSKPLDQISFEVIRGMEFYESAWNSWGTKAEVSYFLPRLLEFLASDITVLGYPSTFGLFKYKLRGTLEQECELWTPTEKEALRQFFLALLKMELNHLFQELDSESYLQRFDLHLDASSVMHYFATCLMIGLTGEELIQAWKATGTFHVNAIAIFLDALEFDCSPGLIEDAFVSWKLNKQVPDIDTLRASRINLRVFDFVSEDEWWKNIHAIVASYCMD